MIFGITEAGDASMNYEWEEKLNEIDGCILITKNLTQKFIKRLLMYKNKPIILHVSCTGYGKTVLEKNLPTYKETIENLKILLNNGWDIKRTVFRIDPIIPTKKGIQLFENVLRTVKEEIPELKRFRISVMDNYPHIQKRFKKIGLPELYSNYFQASFSEFKELNEKIKELKEIYSDISIESCAETKLPETERFGCVSERDFEILDLHLDNKELKGQRKNCLCVCAKKELLTYKYNQTGYNHCYGCLYCYWKTEQDFE